MIRLVATLGRIGKNAPYTTTSTRRPPCATDL